MEQTTDIQQYWEIIKRRKFHIILPAVAVFCLSVIIAFVLPPVYKSMGTILIEAQEIPEDIVRTTVTGYVEERLQMINQVVMSRRKLLEIINRFGLYEDLKDRYTAEEIIEKMRKDITMETIQTEVVNPRSGRPGSATIAFSLSYEGKDPEKVDQVANVLCSFYLEENLKNREKKAETTFQFWEGQLEKLRSDILDTESKIAEFKQKNISVLPELMQVNLQTMERLQRDISTKEEQIKTLQNRKIYLEGQLATIEPIRYTVNLAGRRVMTPREELEALRSEYLGLRATHSEEHPDIISLKKKVEAMESEVITREELRNRSEELHNKETQLALISRKFSSKHPDVIKLKKEVAGLKAEVSELSEKQFAMKAGDEKPENPSYINLQTQITSTQLDMDSIQKQLKLSKEGYRDYQRRVEITPQVEQQYRALERDYANVQVQYKETMNRLMAAREARGLEESRMGEKFTLVDPPITVYRATELAQVAGYPVLAVIPYLETSQDRAKKLRKRLVVIGSTVGFIVIGLAALHYLYQPLDILWVKVMRNLWIGF